MDKNVSVYSKIKRLIERNQANNCNLCSGSDNVISRVIYTSVETAAVGAFFCVSPKYFIFACYLIRPNADNGLGCFCKYKVESDALSTSKSYKNKTTLQNTNLHVIFAFVRSSLIFLVPSA